MYSNLKIDPNLHRLLAKAIDQWVHATGVSPDENQKWANYDVHETYGEFNEAQKLDPTGLTSAMLLRAFIQELAENTSFTARELIEAPEEVKTVTSKMRVLIDTLEQPAISRATEDFIQWSR